MTGPTAALARAQAFAATYGLRVPILLAPMAGACPPALSVAVVNGGGMGACGALTMSAEQIADWVGAVRAGSNGVFQLNTWIPDAPPVRDPDHEAALRSFLSRWGPPVPEDATDAPPPDFPAQVEAMLAAGPPVMSSIMGLYPPDVVALMKERQIRWLATATTVCEAKKATDAGADAIVAQGMEAGGHRGAFRASDASASLVGLFSLLPAIVDAVNVPVIATGGIADGRGIAAALMLGASAVQIGTGFLRTPEAGIAAPWADAIGEAEPEDTMATRAFSGRLGRSLRTAYVETAASPNVPEPAPYPIQRSLTGPMRAEAAKTDSVDRMQAWAGQSARLAQARPAQEIVETLWADAEAMLSA